MLPTFLSIRACLIATSMFGVTAAMAFSNADTTTGLTFNGAAKTFTGPGGGTVILLTPAQPGPPSSVFTTNAVVFDSPIAVADNSTTRPEPLISYPIDIPSLLGQSSAFVGFTAGTGNGWEKHMIANWRFRTCSPCRNTP